MKAKNPAAVELGRLGGLKRAAVVSADRRKEIAATASAARKTRKGWPKDTPRGPRQPKP